MATQVQNRRLVRDNALTVTKVLPAASGNNTSPSINIGFGPYHPEQITLEIAFPATAANTSTSDTYTALLVDSADNITFVAVSPIVELVVPGVASTGAAAITATIKPPANVRQYVAFKVTATSGTGDNTAQTVTYSLLT
jgi:hypothetical protein